MMNVRIRAKSGLHAGATWLQAKNYFSMGSNPHSDVFLCDQDVPDTLLTLRRFGRRYEIEAIHPEAKALTADKKATERTLFAGQGFTLDYRHIQLEVDVLSQSGGLGSALADRYLRLFHWVLSGLRQLGAKAIVAILFLISLFITTYILFFGSVGTVNAKPSKLIEHHLSASKAKNIPLVELNRQIMQSLVNDLKQLANESAIKTYDYTVEGEAIEIRSVLSRKQTQNMERILRQLARDYGSTISITAVSRLTDEQLLVDEVQISQLILGDQPVAILNDGERLYQGGEYRGLRILSINSDRVLLQGSTQYEVML